MDDIPTPDVPPAPVAADALDDGAAPENAHSAEAPVTPRDVGPPDAEAAAPDRAARMRGAVTGLLMALAVTGVAITVLPLQPPNRVWQAWVLLGIGIATGLPALWVAQSPRSPAWLNRPVAAVAGWFGLAPLQLHMLLMAVVLSFATWLAAGDQRHMLAPLVAVGAWLLAIALMIGAARTPHTGAADESRAGLDGIVEPEPVERWEWLALGGILVVAVLARLVLLGQIPWLIDGDEARQGLAAWDFFMGVWNNIFINQVHSFPGLQPAVQALPYWFLGKTTVAMRLTTALAGVATVAATWWFGRIAFDKYVGIAAAAFLATFHYHLQFSRLGFNNGWDGLVLALLSALVFRAWLRNHRLSFALAGLVLGLAPYWFITARVAFGLVPVWLAFMLIFRFRQFRQRLPGVVLMLAAALITFMPLLNYYIDRPGEFTGSLSRSSAIQPVLDGNHPDPAGLLIDQFSKAALGFVSQDLTYGFYNSGTPMLLPFAAALFVLGLMFMLLRLFSPQYAWLAIWLGGAIALLALSVSPPASQRLVHAPALVAVLVALPVVTLARWAIEGWPDHERWIVRAAALVTMLVMAGDLWFYFGDYTANRTFGDLNTETANVVGWHMRTRPDDTQIYFFITTNFGYRSIPSSVFLAPQDPDTVVEISSGLLGLPATLPPGQPVTFLVPAGDSAVMAGLFTRYPGGTATEYTGREARLLLATYDLDP